MLRIYRYYHYQPHRGIVQQVCFGVWTTSSDTSRLENVPSIAGYYRQQREIVESYTRIFNCLQDLKSLYAKSIPKSPLRVEYSRDHTHKAFL